MAEQLTMIVVSQVSETFFIFLKSIFKMDLLKQNRVDCSGPRKVSPRVLAFEESRIRMPSDYCLPDF